MHAQRRKTEESDDGSTDRDSLLVQRHEPTEEDLTEMTDARCAHPAEASLGLYQAGEGCTGLFTCSSCTACRCS